MPDQSNPFASLSAHGLLGFFVRRKSEDGDMPEKFATRYAGMQCDLNRRLPERGYLKP
jgi:hypothetical protein